VPESQELGSSDACCKALQPVVVKVVVEEEEAMGDKGEEGWLLIPALAWLTSIIDRGATADVSRHVGLSSDTRNFF